MESDGIFWKRDLEGLSKNNCVLFNISIRTVLKNAWLIRNCMGSGKTGAVTSLQADSAGFRLSL